MVHASVRGERHRCRAETSSSELPFQRVLWRPATELHPKTTAEPTLWPHLARHSKQHLLSAARANSCKRCAEYVHFHSIGRKELRNWVWGGRWAQMYREREEAVFYQSVGARGGLSGNAPERPECDNLLRHSLRAALTLAEIRCKRQQRKHDLGCSPLY